LCKFNKNHAQFRYKASFHHLCNTSSISRRGTDCRCRLPSTGTRAACLERSSISIQSPRIMYPTKCCGGKKKRIIRNAILRPFEFDNHCQEHTKAKIPCKLMELLLPLLSSKTMSCRTLRL
jgi:hypothetical protein